MGEVGEGGKKIEGEKKGVKKEVKRIEGMGIGEVERGVGVF